MAPGPAPVIPANSTRAELFRGEFYREISNRRGSLSLSLARVSLILIGVVLSGFREILFSRSGRVIGRAEEVSVINGDHRFKRIEIHVTREVFD